MYCPEIRTITLHLFSYKVYFILFINFSLLLAFVFIYNFNALNLCSASLYCLAMGWSTLLTWIAYFCSANALLTSYCFYLHKSIHKDTVGDTQQTHPATAFSLNDTTTMVLCSTLESPQKLFVQLCS